ncbi:unnamed protein product, partial [Owenia fusiformis]
SVMAENLEKFSRHRIQNLQRFKTNFNAIIDKYDQAFPESDIVDLENLIIEKDMGFVRDHKPTLFGKAPLKVTSRLDTDQLLEETRLIHGPGWHGDDEDMGRYSDDGSEEYSFHGDQASIAVYSMIQERRDDTDVESSDAETIDSEDSVTVVSEDDGSSGDEEFSSIRPSPFRKKLNPNEDVANHTESTNSDQAGLNSDSGYIDSLKYRSKPNLPVRVSKQQTPSPRNTPRSRQRRRSPIKSLTSTHGAIPLQCNYIDSKNAPHQVSNPKRRKDSDGANDDSVPIYNDEDTSPKVNIKISPDTFAARRAKDIHMQSNEIDHSNIGATRREILSNNKQSRTGIKSCPGDTKTNISRIKAPRNTNTAKILDEKFKHITNNSTFIIPSAIKQSYARPTASPRGANLTPKNCLSKQPHGNDHLESTRISEIEAPKPQDDYIHDDNIHDEDDFSDKDIHQDHTLNNSLTCKAPYVNHIPPILYRNDSLCGNHSNQNILPVYQDGSQFSSSYHLSGQPMGCCPNSVYPSSSTIVHVCPMYSTAINNTGHLNESFQEHPDGSHYLQYGHQSTSVNSLRQHTNNQPQIDSVQPQNGRDQPRNGRNQPQNGSYQPQINSYQPQNGRNLPNVDSSQSRENSNRSRHFFEDDIDAKQRTKVAQKTKMNDSPKMKP